MNSLFLLLILNGISSCRNESGEQQRGQGALLVEGYRVEPGEFSIDIRSTGDLLSYEEVELMTPVSGNVLRIHFQDAQQVSRGAPLVEIDNRVWKAQKRGLEARLSSARSEMRRKTELLEIPGIQLAVFYS